MTTPTGDAAPNQQATSNPFLLAEQAHATLHEAEHHGKGAEENFKAYNEISEKLKGVLADCRQEDGSIDLMKTDKLTGSTVENRQMEIINLNSVLTGIKGALDFNRVKDYRQMDREARAEAGEVDAFYANMTGGADGEPQFDDNNAMIVPSAFHGRGGRQIVKPSQVWEATLAKQHDGMTIGPDLAKMIAKDNRTLTIEQPIFDQQGRNIYADTFETNHWDPDSQREMWWTPLRQTRLQICHLFHTMTTGTDIIRYMKETTHSSAAAEKAEGAAAPESNYALTESEIPIRRISHIIPVTEEALADGTPRSIVRQYLNYVLPMGVWQRVDKQLMNGNGTAPNLSGVLNHAITKTKYSFAGDSGSSTPSVKHWNLLLESIFRIQDWGSNEPYNILGSQMATHILINPAIWADTLKTESSSGGYYFGGPQSGLINTAWGLPVVPTDHLVATASTDGAGNHKFGVLVGDFSPMFSGLWFRHGVETQTGMQKDNFEKFTISMRCSVRVGFAVHRGAAFNGLVNPKADNTHPTG